VPDRPARAAGDRRVGTGPVAALGKPPSLGRSGSSVVLRRLAPVLVGVVAVVATVGAILVLSGGDALDTDPVTGQGGPVAAPLDEPGPDGTYVCNPMGNDGAPRLTAPTGFHAEPFELELVAPDGDPLYYTLDGSYPDPVANPEATIEYDGPISIDVMTGPYPLTYLRSAFDRDELAAGRAADPTWNVTRRDTPGATIVRARTIDLSAPTTIHDPADVAGVERDPDDGPAGEAGDMDEPQDPGDLDDAEADPPGPAPVERASGSAECVGVFFVGDDLVRPELPVLHLALEPSHLFDHDTGIYLPGQAFEEYLDSDEFDAQWAEQFGLVPANYRGRGREWERPFEHDLDDAVVLHHFDAGGQISYATNLGVRIHGGWTRAFPQKSFRLYARNDYGHRTFDHAFFGDDEHDVHRRLILRNSGNDWEWTMLLDGYVQELIHDWDVETQAFQPAVLFINGEYWGIHNIRDRYDRHYLEIAHDVDPDNVAIITGYGDCCHVNTGEPGDEEPFMELLADLEQMDPADDATLEFLESQVDVDDLIEYLVLQLYISNTDWPQNNLKLWREKVEPDPQLGTTRDGRWRWLVYDLDFVGDLRRDHFHDPFPRLAEVVRDADGNIYASLGIPFLFEHMIGNDGFRERFATRFADAANTSFRADHAVAKLRELTDLLEPEIEHHTRRWGNSSSATWWPADSPDAWWGRIIEVQTFFQERPGVARHFASEHLGLGGAVSLQVRTSGAEHGHVVVNDVEVVDATPGVDDPADWDARYFREVPVTVRAVPADGYRFVGWDAAPSGSLASENGEVAVLHLADDETTITAVFEPA
jgi:hypothetical protein